MKRKYYIPRIVRVEIHLEDGITAASGSVLTGNSSNEEVVDQWEEQDISKTIDW